MNLAEEIKKNFKPKQFSWYNHLENYLKKEFSKGTKYVDVYGCFGNGWVENDDLDSFNIHSISDWLLQNGFIIVNTNKYDLGDWQFKITVRLPD